MMKKKLAFVMAMALSAGLVLPGCTSGTGTTSSTGSTTSGDASSAGSTSSSGTQVSTVTGGKEGGTSLTFTTGGDQGTYYGFGGVLAQKVGEEAVETVIEATNGTDERLIYEGADLIYHLIVLLTSKGYRIEDLAKELQARHCTSWKKH